MKSIITWNVNGIRAIAKKGFFEWLEQEDPDILCVQETKAKPEQLGQDLLSPDAYSSYWHSAKRPGYSGVMTYSKEKPLEVMNMGMEEFDIEGRVQVLTYDAFTLINAYFPNSQDKGRRVGYKVAFCKAMLQLCNDFRREGRHIILCGDYNIAHKRIDLKNPDSNEDSPGFLPEERAWMDEFVAEGYVDSFRAFCDEPDHYTWWSYRTRARERNAGWRIDYHCVDADFQKHVCDCVILDDVMGSDHCPVKLVLK